MGSASLLALPHFLMVGSMGWPVLAERVIASAFDCHRIVSGDLLLVDLVTLRLLGACLRSCFMPSPGTN